MAKDIRRAMDAERRIREERGQQVDIDVPVEGYQRRISAAEIRQIEREREALRQRLFAAG